MLSCQHGMVNFEQSSDIPSQCGVPEGFVLGPVLFNYVQNCQLLTKLTLTDNILLMSYTV